MTLGWGTEQWGLDPWGGATPGSLPPPTLTALVGDGILDVRGGTVLEMVGMDFFPEFIPQVLFGPAPHILIAEGYLFDARFDIRNRGTRALPGMPPAASGTYHLRIKTPAGLSNVLLDVLTYTVFAEEWKVQKASRSYATPWRTSRRISV